MNVLWVKTSLTGEASESNKLALHLLEDLRKKGESVELVERDLSLKPVPHLDGFRLEALGTAVEQRTEEQAQVVAQADELLAEVKAADVILIGLPMYNFNISSQLKSWFDHLARAGLTFSYTEHGPQGLLDNKPVYLLATRGGLYAEAGLDYQIGYVKQFLAFIGLKDTRVVLAEGLAMETHREQSLAQAKEALVS